VHESWKDVLSEELCSSYFLDLQETLRKLSNRGVSIYPPQKEVYSAFELTPLDEVKVVIIGQDPYHGNSQAHGLAFSVREGSRIPPSLRNILKELHADLGLDIPKNGDLTPWANNGVFLLNTILTVEAKSPGSHRNMGWERFTDLVIRVISEKNEKVVFMLWGAFAHKKHKLIDESKHLILRAPHPAAEVYQGGKAGFFGSRPFSKANEFIDKTVDWALG
jgi:uracil-DNA glycosylase